jgi:phosphoribosyl 1,2-cyclic phosphate phosphodiesterase
MELLLLGTGASDGIPAFFNDSRVSRHAREHCGKDVRTRSCALLNGDIQIDFPPDLFCQYRREGLDPQDWSALVFTHSHEDHFCVSELQYALFPFTDRESLPYVIYANAEIERKIEARYPEWPIEIVQTHSFESYQLGKVKLTPIAAHHKEDEDSQNLIFEQDGKTILYATDTGVWREPTWEFLQGWSFDLLILECTDGKVPQAYHGHLSIETAVSVVDRLRTMNALHSGSTIVTTHHSHLGEATHAELERLLEPHAIHPGFDGMRLTLG